MIFVVEIASCAGIRACKEYDAPSLNGAVEAVTRVCCRQSHPVDLLAA